MYSSSTDRRSAFSDGDLSTASPSQVVVKCFDRLDADLDRALLALEQRDYETANSMLGHAQDLLGEMAGMLDVSAWEHAGSLLAVYDYLLRILAIGNLRKEPALIGEAKHLVSEIGSGFRSAASVEPAPAPTAGAGAYGARSEITLQTGAPSQNPPDRPKSFSALA